MDFARDVAPLARWFAQRGISTEGLTVILNFRDARSAAQFDAEFRRDVASDVLLTLTLERVDQFEAQGIKFKLESPVHGS